MLTIHDWWSAMYDFGDQPLGNKQTEKWAVSTFISNMLVVGTINPQTRELKDLSSTIG